MIPKTCHELKIQFYHYDGQQLNESMTNSAEYLKNIEKLEIEAFRHFPKRFISSFILNHFPKLRSINMSVTYDNEIKYVTEMFKDKKLSFLQRLGKSNVTGKLIFKNQTSPKSREVIPSFEQVLQDVQNIAGVTSDAERKTITRTVKLKENLIVEFKLFFNNFEYYKNL